MVVCIGISVNQVALCKVVSEDDQKIIVNAPSVLDYLNEESKERFHNVCKGLDILEINYQIDKKH